MVPLTLLVAAVNLFVLASPCIYLLYIHTHYAVSAYACTLGFYFYPNILFDNMNMIYLQANFQDINTHKISPKNSPKINFPVCIMFKSIDQRTGNLLMPSSEMGGSPIQATDAMTKNRPQKLSPKSPQKLAQK